MDNFSDKSEISTTRVMVMAALWAAIVFCMTMFPKVPIPLGYMNLGTTTIFLSMFFLRRREACLAGAVGSCLADLIGGFPIWIIPTAVVKFAVAFAVYTVMKIVYREGSFWISSASAFITGSAVSVIGYTFFGVFLFGGFEASLQQVPGLAIEGVMSTVVALVVCGFLKARLSLKI